MATKRKLYFWILILALSIFGLFFIIKGGITGNPIYRAYTIEDFPGIYVDFGPTQSEGSSKWGASAVGNVGEFWNAPFISGSQYTFFPIRYANGDLSNMNMQMSNLDKSSTIKSNLEDSMFEDYVYSDEINKVSSVSISNLIGGEYDIYLYGNLESTSSNYELYKSTGFGDDIESIFLGLKSTNANSDVLLKETLEEGAHYVVYKNVFFNEGDSMEIIVKSFDLNGERSLSFISGMQIVRSGTKLAYDSSATTKTLECYDSDGGIDFDVSGKIYLNGRYSSEDLCDNQNTFVNELSCENGIKTITLHECDYGCVDGFCIPDFKFRACDGCLYNQICISKGTRVDNKYCDNDKFLKIQKSQEGKCTNSFECKTNSCLEGKCESLDSIARKELGAKYGFVKLLCRLGSLSSDNYHACLENSFSPLIGEKRESEIKIEDKEDVNFDNGEQYALPEPSLSSLEKFK